MLWKFLRLALEIYLGGLVLLRPVAMCIMRVAGRNSRREELEDDMRRFNGDKMIYRS